MNTQNTDWLNNTIRLKTAELAGQIAIQKELKGKRLGAELERELSKAELSITRLEAEIKSLRTSAGPANCFMGVL